MNTHGQLGDGSEFDPTAPIGDSFPRPVTVIAEAGSTDPLTGVTAIAAGYAHTCALLGDGTVKCWGWNSGSEDPFAIAGTGGQLGDGTTIDRLAPVTVIAEAGSATPMSGVTAIVAGWFYTCALLADGTARCWGDATFRGGLGDGTRASSLTPVTVIAEAGSNSPLAGILALEPGDFKTCALLSDTTVKCWGDNYISQVSEGGAGEDAAPVVVAASPAGGEPLSEVTAIDVAGGFTQDSGGYVACALMNDGNVKCWGNNDFGGLGDGTTTSSRTPVDVVGVTGATAITDGCALLLDLTVRCWPARGPVGDSGPFTVTKAADSGTALTDVAAIESGGFHATAVLADGSVMRWLGDEPAVPIEGVLVVPPDPVPVATPAPTAAQVAASSAAGPEPAPTLGQPATVGVAPGQPTPPSSFRQSVPTPADINLDPLVLVQGVIIATGIVLLVPFPSAIFNNTLQEHYAEIVGRVRDVRRRLRALLVNASRWTVRRSRRSASPSATEPQSAAPGIAARRDFWRTPVGIALFVLVTALLGSFLDPTIAFDSTSVAAFIGLTAGLVVLLVSSNLVPAIAYRWSGVGFFVRALPGTLAVGVGCVLISRFTDFQPGYLYGLIVGLVAAQTLGKTGAGRTAAVATIVLLTVAAAAWLGLWWVPDLTPIGGVPSLGVVALQTAFATIVVGGLEGAAIGLLPLRFLPGDTIKAWNLRVWLGLFLFAGVAFLVVLVNPTSGYLADNSRTPLLTIVGLLFAFSLTSVAFWAYFRYRREPVVRANT